MYPIGYGKTTTSVHLCLHCLIAWVAFVGAIFIFINAEVRIKKVVAVAAIGLGLVWGGAQAESDVSTGSSLIIEYVKENDLKGSDVDEMWIAAWRCYGDNYDVMAGAELKELGVPLEADRRSLNMDEKGARLTEEGYKYKKPMDIEIGNFSGSLEVETC